MIQFIFSFYQKIKKDLFIGPLILGVLTWLFFFITTPTTVVNAISISTILFIALNYITFVLGYYFLKNKKSKENNKGSDFKIESFSYFVIGIVVLSSVIRYIDLFFIRDASFLYTTEKNKFNIANEKNFSLCLGILSVFRMLYFVPFVLYKVKNKKRVILLVICLLLFLIPISEGFLRGSRRLILEPFGILLITMLIFRGRKLRIDFKKIILSISVLFLLLLSSRYIINERLQDKSTTRYKELLSSFYNDFLPLNEKTKNYLIESDDTTLKEAVFFYCHFGQYVTHGVFEFDYMKDKEFNSKYGMYNSFIIIKMLNKMNITNVSLDTLMNPSGRVTFITFFGGLYFDFRWFSIIIMFFFGMLQEKVFSQSDKHNYLKPIVILCILINFSLLIFNFLRAQFLITIIIYMIVLWMFHLSVKYRPSLSNYLKIK